MRITRINFCFRISLIIVVLLGSKMSLAQSKVAFVTAHTRDICSANNDVLKGNQLVMLNVEGPEDGAWCFSYSIDGRAEVIANENELINSNVYSLRMSIKNESNKNRDYSVRIVRAWREGDIMLEIDNDRSTRIIPVLSLPKIEIDDYDSIVKLSTEHEYVFRVADDSEYFLNVPSSCELLSTDETYEGFDLVVTINIRWPSVGGNYVIDIQESNIMDCYSDKEHIAVECVDKVVVTMPEQYYACEGNSAILKPMYDVDSDATFSWSTGATTSSIEVSDEGDYSVSVFSALEGVTKKLNTRFSYAQKPIINLDDIYVKEDSRFLDLSLSNDNSTFLWSTGSNTSSTKIIESGAYNVVVTSDAGCENTKSFTVRNKSELFTIDLVSEFKICKDETLRIVPKTSIIQNYKYVWNNGSDKSSIVVSTSGLYSVDIFDDFSYKQSASVDLTVEDPYSIISIEDKYVLQENEIIAVSIPGSDLKYKWSTGETRSSINISKKGKYFVEVTTSIGCVSRKEFEVWNQSDYFQITSESVQHVCKNEDYLISAETNIDQNYTYRWNTGEQTKSIKVSDPGVYHVVVTDDNSYAQEKDIELVVHEYPIISDLEESYVLKENSSVDIEMPDNGLFYNWSTGDTTPNVSINTSGDFFLEVSNNYSCKTKKEFRIRDAADMFSISMPGAVDACANNLIKLSPSLSIDQNYSYEWSTGETTKSIDVTTDGVYTVMVKDDLQFSQQASTKLTIHPLPIVDLGSDKILWGSETITIDAGAGAEKYKWNTGAEEQKIDVSESGEYSVDVTNEYGCESNGAINLVINKGTRFQPRIDVFSVPDELLQEADENVYYMCQGNSLVLRAVVESGVIAGDPVYMWSGSTKTESFISIDKAGIYELSVFDMYSNEMKTSVEVVLSPAPIVDLGLDIIGTHSPSVVLDAGGVDVKYKWSTDEISQFITVDKPGEYSVVITNEYGCSGKDDIDVSFFEGYPYVGLPNVFSPNNDGLNDEIKLIGVNYKEVELSIFNRLGVRVFYTKNSDVAWDGRYKGVMQDSDNYVYTLKITHLDNYKELKYGGFILIH